MCATRMDQFNSPTVRRRDPVLRLSNAADIKSIIDRFEKRLDEPPRSPSFTKKIPSCYLSDMGTVKSDNSKAIVKKEALYDAIEENEWYFDEESPAPTGITWRVLRMALYGLTCFFWASHMSLAMIMVTIATFAPRMITDLFIYPCCRLLFGTLYPAYASYKAVRTKNVKEYVKWMMYWIVFALFTCAETFTDVFLSWFPFYYEIKIILVFWLLSPATKGSSILYRKFVHPALCRREQEIDECITKAKEQGYHTVLNLGSKGVNYATNVIVQTALRSGGGIVQQIRKSYSLSDLTVSDDQSDGHGQQVFEGAVSTIIAPGTDTRLVRRAVSVKSKNPRPTSAPRVDMYFPEVDVNMTHKQNRDSINLSHIRSSEDISIAHVPDSSSSQDSLTRTSSVGSTRTRSKVTRNTFTSIKRPGAAEDDDVIIEEVDDDEVSLSEDQNESAISEASIFRDVYKAYVMKHMDLKIDEYNYAEIFDQVYKIRDYLKRKQDSDISKEAKRVCINDNNKENTIDNNELNLKAEVECKKCEIIEIKEDKLCLNAEKLTDDDNKIVDEIKDVKLVDEIKDVELVEQEDNAIVVEEVKDVKLAEKEDNKIVVEKVEDVKLVEKEDVTLVEKEDHNIVVEEVKNDKIYIKEDDTIVDEIKNVKLVERENDVDKEDVEDNQEFVDAVIQNDLIVDELETSQSNLSSDAEDGNVEFTTPNSSPVMKTKFDKSPKIKKRPAPPPPIQSTSEIQTDLNVNASQEIIENVSLSGPIDIIKSEEVSIKNIKEEDKVSDVSGEKSPQLTKNKSKKRDPISKLLHLPTKFAFWNKNENDESDSKSISSDSDFGSLIDLKGQNHDNASMKSYSSVSTLPDNDESARRRDSLKASVDSSLDSVFIPLSVESLVLHTESKSTDV